MSAGDSQALKQLESRKAKTQAKISQIKDDISEAKARLADAESAMQSINAQIASLTRKEPVVTEHAIIRYLERAMGLDLEQVKKEVLPDNVAAMVKAMGNGKYPIGSGLKIVVKNATVVSVV